MPETAALLQLPELPPEPVDQIDSAWLPLPAVVLIECRWAAYQFPGEVLKASGRYVGRALMQRVRGLLQGLGDLDQLRGAIEKIAIPDSLPIQAAGSRQGSLERRWG